jgi:hypothetical protein
MHYRDLPAAAFVPQPYAQLAMPEAAKFGSIFISPGGQVHWTCFEEGIGSAIFSGTGEKLALHPPYYGQFRAPKLQRLSDGRWFVAETRTDPETPNAFVFEPDGTLIRSFYAGDGIETLLADKRGKIWIGYFDEGIFGAFDPPKGHPGYRYGPNGLVRIDDRGDVEFAYNELFPKRFISDIQALTLDDSDRAWFCPYTDYFLASASRQDVDFVLPRTPFAGADAISIGDDCFAFFGGYTRSSMIALVNRSTLRLRLIQLCDDNGNTLSPTRVATRGTRAIAAASDKLYRLDQDILLATIGPWTDGNTSTLESALQYLDEETSYTGYYLLDSSGSRKIPGTPRPPQNQPRHDNDTGK